jgi:hypothetical protein
MFLRLMSEHTFLHLMTNLFYDVQSKFQNKVVLAKKTSEVSPFYNFPEHIFSNTCVIWTFTDLDKGSLPVSLN